MNEAVNQGIPIVYQLGVVGVVLIALGYFAYILVKRLMRQADEDRQALFVTVKALRRDVKNNGRVARAVRGMAPEIKAIKQGVEELAARPECRGIPGNPSSTGSAQKAAPSTMQLAGGE